MRKLIHAALPHVAWEAMAIGILLALLASQSGCGSSQKGFAAQASATVGTALAATQATSQAFLTWDKAHQLAIVDSSATEEEATAKLAAYRAKRHVVEEAFVVAYNALAAASSAIAIVELGKKPDRDPVALLAEAVKAVLAVKAAVDAVRAPDPAPAVPVPVPSTPEGASP